MRERARLKGFCRAVRLPQLRHKRSLAYDLAYRSFAAYELGAGLHVSNTNRYSYSCVDCHRWRLRFSLNLGYSTALSAGRKSYS